MSLEDASTIIMYAFSLIIHHETLILLYADGNERVKMGYAR